ncbi:MAG TPA: hypothetical protein PK159_07890 [Steroidobacteraceae bacterium]|nr:hypothetical protein [Steroidobacteraceae bacterium]
MDLVAAQSIARPKPNDRCDSFVLQSLAALVISLAARESDQELPDRGRKRRAPLGGADAGAPVGFSIDRNCDIFHLHSFTQHRARDKRQG